MTGLFGSETAEKALLYISRYNEGYAKGIADTFDVSLNMIQKQLKKFELEGVLVSQLKGNTRLFTWNPRYAFLEELKALLNKVFKWMPKAEKQRYYMQRTRPRRTGKPL